MKERPILFSGPMVKAILEGRKTQTRRVVNSAHALGDLDPYFGGGTCEDCDACFYTPEKTGTRICLACPYGQPGDRLWVREAWCQKWNERGFVYNSEGNLDASCVHYRADGRGVIACDGDGFLKWQKNGAPSSPWKPSIHMPRWASRLTLEIASVRVERLQDISEADAQAEGVSRLDISPRTFGGMQVHPLTSTYVEAFRELWDNINGKKPGHAWADSPWVWVIAFKEVSV